MLCMISVHVYSYIRCDVNMFDSNLFFLTPLLQNEISCPFSKAHPFFNSCHAHISYLLSRLHLTASPLPPFFLQYMHLFRSLWFFFFPLILTAQPTACCYGYQTAREVGRKKRAKELRREGGGVQWEHGCICLKKRREIWEMWNWCHSVGSFFLFRLNNYDS